MGDMILLGKLAVSVVCIAASITLILHPKPFALSDRTFDRFCLILTFASRMGLYVSVYFILNQNVTTDVASAYYPQGLNVLDGQVVYRDFESSYSPLFPYLMTNHVGGHRDQNDPPGLENVDLRTEQADVVFHVLQHIHQKHRVHPVDQPLEILRRDTEDVLRFSKSLTGVLDTGFGGVDADGLVRVPKFCDIGSGAASDVHDQPTLIRRDQRLQNTPHDSSSGHEPPVIEFHFSM